MDWDPIESATEDRQNTLVFQPFCERVFNMNIAYKLHKNCTRCYKKYSILGLIAMTAFVLWGHLSGCSTRAESTGQSYRCEQGVEMVARFQANSVTLDTNRGYEVLFRPNDAQTQFYENASMSAEFGLGASQDQAMLRYPVLPLALRCVHDER